MANPWGIAGMTAAISGCLTVLGWFLIPSISSLLSKFFSDLSFDAPRKLLELEIDTIPKLKEMLRGAEKQRMVRSAKDDGPDLMTLNKLTTDLRYALYEAEDILDLIDYHRIEKRVISDSKPSITADRPFEVVGIINNPKDGIAVDSFLRTIDRNSLRKRIEHIENIANDLKKSHLLSQQSSSREIPVNDTNKESSSSEILVKDTEKESSRRQKEIDDLHRRIERKVFGRDKEREHICRKLREGPDAYGPSSSSSKPYSVIGIHGIAGSGKSTLAHYVCDYEKDEGNHFDLVMFIHVSSSFRVDDIFRDMLKQMEQNPPSDGRGLRSQRKELMEKLKGRRFLLVLDDLWANEENEKEQEILLDTLNDALSGSRILVTAQREDAVAALGAQEQISIPDLEEEEYLSLFMHHALKGTVDDNGKFMGIGRKIVKKLCRSPIAAVTVAKQLQRNKRIHFWETTANLDVLNKTMGALWWSYDQLGADIRRCFGYCSTFPRGYKLERDKLVRMWIAQGYVKTSNASEDVEDVGQRYFDVLLTFSFLQPRGGFFGTEHFTIHDLLHELAERVAVSDFFRIDVNGSQKVIPPPEAFHLFIETYNITEITENILDLGNLRTLIIEAKLNSGAPIIKEHDLGKEKFFESMFRRLTKLRVLIVKIEHYHELVFSVPASIDQMKHLRYVSFCTGEHGVLKLTFPSTIRKLYHMQTIDAHDFRSSCDEDVANLINLRHYNSCQNFANIGRLASLQTIPGFVVKKEPGYELQQLKDLKHLRGTLHISGLGIVGSKEEAAKAALARKERVTVLMLEFNKKTCSPDVEADVLEGLCPPEQIVELGIWYFHGSRYPSWMLTRQHEYAPKNLRELELFSCSRLVSIPKESESDFFVCLRKLRFLLCSWDTLPDHMDRLTSLQELEIYKCNKITYLPTLPKSLRCIDISGNSMLITTCRKKGHINWKMIQGIPQKTVAFF